MLEGRQSTNIEDRRGMGGRGIAIGGGGIATLILGLVIYLCGGQDALNIFNEITGGVEPAETSRQQQPQQKANQPPDAQRRFVSSVLASTEDA